MESEHFEVRFLSNEQDFIYNFGVNRGHTLSFSKVNRCYFLSAEAKQLYHNICDYAWGHKRECYPSQATLRAELGWGRHSMEKYLNELRDAGLILTERQGNQMPLIYRITELHRCEPITHSEVIHQIREEISMGAEVFHDALAAYKASETAAGVTNPLDQFPEIKQWFQSFYVGEPVMQPKSIKTGRIRASAPNTGGIPKSSEVQAVGDPDRKPKLAYDPTNTETWNSHHFTDHFQQLYTQMFNAPYPKSAKDVGQMARLVREWHDRKQELLERMETYFTVGLRAPKTIASFCSGHTQSSMDHYQKTGKMPDFKPGRTSKLALDVDLSDYDFNGDGQ